MAVELNHSLTLSIPPPGMSEYYHLFQFGLCDACFMYHHKLWPTSVSHPFSHSTALYALLEENITKKLLSLSLDLFFRILLFQVAFLIYFFIAIFSCDQAVLWMVFSVRLSVCLSICPSVRPSVCPSVTPFWLCSPHRIIMKFSGVITRDQGKVHAKGQGQRSRSQRSRPNLTVSGL